jgi:hypothetical protein
MRAETTFMLWQIPSTSALMALIAAMNLPMVKSCAPARLERMETLYELPTNPNFARCAGRVKLLGVETTPPRPLLAVT